MAITSDNDTRQTSEAVVSVRIPDGADGDLTTEAARRLSQADGVDDVTVDGLRGLDPGLSATVATVTVTVETNGPTDEAALAATLAEVTCIEVVDVRPGG